MRIAASTDMGLPEQRYQHVDCEGVQTGSNGDNQVEMIAQKSDSADRMLRYKELLLELEDVRLGLSNEEMKQVEQAALGDKSYHINCGGVEPSSMNIRKLDESKEWTDELRSIKSTNIVRMLFADFEPVLIETRNTVGRYLLGSTGDSLNKLFLKNVRYNGSLLILWMSGAVIGLCCLGDRLTADWMYAAAILLVPFTVHIFLLLNVTIVFKLFQTFETYLYTFYIASFMVAFLSLNAHTLHERIPMTICIAIYGINLLYTLLTDAAPAATRRIYALVGVSFGALTLVCFILGMYLHWIKMTAEEKMQVGAVTFAASSACTNALMNLLVFECRNLAYAYLYPDYMVICKFYDIT